MNDEHSDTQLDGVIAALLGALRRTRHGKRPSELHFGQVLTELDAWLDDDRQWRHGQAQHWKALLDDLARTLAVLASLSEGGTQQRLDEFRAELRSLRPGFSGDAGPPDDALRRRLRRLSNSARSTALEPDLLVSAWRRLLAWTRTDTEQGDKAVGALRDLLELHDRDADDTLKTIGHVLNDVGWVIAGVRDSQVGSWTDRAGLSPDERFSLVESLLGQPATEIRAVVWLEYLRAELRWPPTLAIGPSVTLYRGDFLRSIIHEDRHDERVPPELRDTDGSELAFWLDASDAEEAMSADREVPGDPRVYLRIELDEMAESKTLSRARDVAEFLAGFASLYTTNHDIWILSESYFIPGLISSTHAFSFDVEKTRDALQTDMTATHLAEHAEALGPHLPIDDDRLRTASRLLVWLRRATAHDDPAQLILSERVIEQVCGWAGVSHPPRFVTSALRPMWIYLQIRRAIENAYWALWDVARDGHDLTDRIEMDDKRRPHSPGNELPSINLKRVLEHLDELVDIAPVDSTAQIRLTGLSDRMASASTLGQWLDDLGGEFDRRNARLRRTRNALMHGGPIVEGTVSNTAPFGVTLAHYALGTAIEFLLAGENLIDGFLERQQRQNSCFKELRSGIPPSDALFWQDAGGGPQR